LAHSNTESFGEHYMDITTQAGAWHAGAGFPLVIMHVWPAGREKLPCFQDGPVSDVHFGLTALPDLVGV